MHTFARDGTSSFGEFRVRFALLTKNRKMSSKTDFFFFLVCEIIKKTTKTICNTQVAWQLQDKNTHWWYGQTSLFFVGNANHCNVSRLHHNSNFYWNTLCFGYMGHCLEKSMFLVVSLKTIPLQAPDIGSSQMLKSHFSCTLFGPLGKAWTNGLTRAGLLKWNQPFEWPLSTRAMKVSGSWRYICLNVLAGQVTRKPVFLPCRIMTVQVSVGRGQTWPCLAVKRATIVDSLPPGVHS